MENSKVDANEDAKRGRDIETMNTATTTAKSQANEDTEKVGNSQETMGSGTTAVATIHESTAKGTRTMKKHPAKKRTFDDNLKALRAYVNRFGDANVPKVYEPDPALGRFVCKVRNRRSESLSSTQRQQLESLGFDFETRQQKLDRAWEKSYQELVAYKAKNGHVKFPKANSGLGRWVSKQREKYKQGVLRKDQIDRLEELDFVWNRRKGKFKDDPDKESPQWLANYQKLVNFQKEHGHCFYPYPKPGEDSTMYLWISRQRSDFRLNGRLPGNRKQLLENIGFPWKVDHSYRACLNNQQEWDAMFAELIKFHQEFGHAWVPRGYKNKQLARFVANNIASGRNGTLDSMRGKKLQALGLYWGRDDGDGWNSYFDRLKAHREIEEMLGTSRPIEGSDIADWMRRQLHFYKKGALAVDRRKKLEEIDFFANTPQEARMGSGRKPLNTTAQGKRRKDLIGKEEDDDINAEKSRKSSKSRGKRESTGTAKEKRCDVSEEPESVAGSDKGHPGKSGSNSRKKISKSRASHGTKDCDDDNDNDDDGGKDNKGNQGRRKLHSSSIQDAEDDSSNKGAESEAVESLKKLKSAKKQLKRKIKDEDSSCVEEENHSKKAAKAAPETGKPGQTPFQKKRLVLESKADQDDLPAKNLRKRARTSKSTATAAAKKDNGPEVGRGIEDTWRSVDGNEHAAKAPDGQKPAVPETDKLTIVSEMETADQIAKASIAKTLLDLQSSEKKQNEGIAAVAKKQNDAVATMAGKEYSDATSNTNDDAAEEEEDIQTRLPIGTLIRKRSPSGWRIGKIAEHSTGKAKIRYEDNEEEDMSEDELDVAATAYEMHMKKKKKRRR